MEDLKKSENLYPQEKILISQIKRQQIPLSEQKLMLEDVKKQELSLINKIIIIDSFSSISNDHSDWEFTNFYSIDGKPNETRGEWCPANLQSFSHGLQLRSLVLKSRPKISLKSLACEMKISLRLSGDSSFWLMTRGLDIKDPDSTVIKFKKEQDSQRVFLIFGANLGTSGEFRFFKRQEIPEIGEISEDWIIQDFVELKLLIIDNGDDKIIVNTIGPNKKASSMLCNKYIPTFKDTNIFIAGSGDSVLLKNFSARQIERVESEYTQRNHYECCMVF